MKDPSAGRRNFSGAVERLIAKLTQATLTVGPSWLLPLSQECQQNFRKGAPTPISARPHQRSTYFCISLCLPRLRLCIFLYKYLFIVRQYSLEDVPPHIYLYTFLSLCSHYPMACMKPTNQTSATLVPRMVPSYIHCCHHHIPPQNHCLVSPGLF